MAGCLERFSLLSMIGPQDAARAVALGAPPQRVRVEGNAKYAGLAQRVAALDPAPLAARLALGEAPLLVAGSVRSGEEAAVLGAFKQVLTDHPGAVLAVAPATWKKPPLAGRGPRHGPHRPGLERSGTGQPPAARHPAGGGGRHGPTAHPLRPGQGRLCGGLVGAPGRAEPHGARRLGVPTAFGPDMADFLDAALALQEAGGAQTVGDAHELAAWWERMLAAPQEAAAAGQAARRVVGGWSGAASAAAGHILDALTRQGV